jgi:hypothetical protein
MGELSGAGVREGQIWGKPVVTDGLKSCIFQCVRGDSLFPIGLLIIPILVQPSLYVGPLLGNDREISGYTIAVDN